MAFGKISLLLAISALLVAHVAAQCPTTMDLNLIAVPVVGQPATAECSATAVADTCAVVCGSGYTTTSVGSVACLASNAWDTAYTDPLVCAEIAQFCPLPVDDKYNFTTCTDNSMNATCTPTCSLGYKIDGSIGVLTCSGSGNATDDGTFDAPSGCVIDDAFCPAAAAQPGYDVSLCGATILGDSCLPTCAIGYGGTATTIACLESKSYNSSTGCAVNTTFCQVPAAQEGYNFTTCGITSLNTSCTPTCAAGYTGTAAVIACLSNAAYNASSGCVRNNAFCQAAASQTGYDVSSCGVTYINNVCNPTCVLGYTGTPTPMACLNNDGTGSYNTSTGCLRNNTFCAAAATQTGYDVSSCVATYLDNSCTPACAVGYTGTAAKIVCKNNNAYNLTSGCSLDTAWCPAKTQTGYTFTCASNVYNAQCTATCAQGYTGTATSVTCGADKNWTTSTGCVPSKTGAATQLTSFIAVILSIAFMILNILA